MADQSLFIDKAYQEALAYADKTINASAQVKNNYTESDAFYYQMKSKDIALMFLYLVISIAALIFKRKVWELIEIYALTKVDIGSLKDYLSMLYTIGFIVLLLIGVWQLLKFIYAKKTNADLNKLEKIASELEKEKGFANGIKNTVMKAIENYEFVQVGNPNKWEEKIASYQTKADTVGKKTRNMGMWLTIVGSLVSIGVFYFVFSPYIVDAIAGTYNFYGTMAVCISYLLLMGLIYRIQMQLASYTRIISKLMGFVLFGLFQIAMVLLLKKTNAFTPIINIAEYSQGSDPDWLANIIRFSIKYLINEGVLVMAIVSIIGLMNFIRTNPERESLAIKNGVDIPLDNGTSRHADAKQRWSSILFASLFAIVAPFLMSNILIKGASFGRVILYLAIGLAWFAISTTFTGDEEKAMYGKRLGWVKNAFFFSYMFLTLALVPGFGVGSVVLLLIQSILSLIAVGVLFSVI